MSVRWEVRGFNQVGQISFNLFARGVEKLSGGSFVVVGVG